MIQVQYKPLLKRLNPLCQRSLHAAVGLCATRSHYDVTVEHLLLEALDDASGDLHAILRHYEIEPARIIKSLERALERLKSGNAGKPSFDDRLLMALQEAWLLSSVEWGESLIRSGAILTAVLLHGNLSALSDTVEELEHIRLEDLRQRFRDIVAGSSEDGAVADGPGARRTQDSALRTQDSALAGATAALDRFTVDLTAQARAGQIDPVLGRSDEIRQMIDILTRRRKNNPILVGEPGVGKTAVVEGLALRIVAGEVPPLLANTALRVLDLGLLQAGASVKGEFENRLKAVIDEVKAHPTPIITFIDEAHTLIGAGAAAGSSDAANLLKPALARGELRTIAATTWSEYKKYFEKDAALERRFQMVKIDEPSEANALVMLRGVKHKFEQHHKVHILDDAVQAAVTLSSRYISGRQLPDKAVDLLDTAASRVAIGLHSPPAALEDLRRRRDSLEVAIRAQQRDLDTGVLDGDGQLATMRSELETVHTEAEKLELRWRKASERAEQIVSLRRQLHVEAPESPQTVPSAASGTQHSTLSTRDSPADVAALRNELDAAVRELESLNGESPLVHVHATADTMATVVADWTGIPAGRLMKDEYEVLLNFEQRMGQRIIGQDHAVGQFAERIRTAKAGLQNPTQPIAVFLLVGPSGVGKTESALAIADLLFGGERFMVTVNMSEYMEKHSVSRLIGSPPGYVGFGQGGVLTEAVRRRPYSVVLLDEVEKADPEVLNLFYQVFDKGTLADGEGREIDFSNTVLLLTSNLGTDLIQASCAEGQRPAPEQLSATIYPILRQHFKPALLARMTMVPFYALDRETMKKIVALKLDRLARRLLESQEITFDVSPECIDGIAARCTEIDTGARNVDHIIDRTLLPAISTEILTRLSTGESMSHLQLGIGEQGQMTLDFS